MATGMEAILLHVPAWLLVFFRLAGLFFFAPVLGSSMIPARFRVSLALAMSLCVYPALLRPDASAFALLAPMLTEPLHLWALPLAVASEMLIGFVIGYGATLPLIGMQIAGQMIDQQMGMGFAGLVNPEFDSQQGVISEFLFYLSLTIFLIAGGHRVLLATLVGSFSHVPLGGFRVDGDLVRLMVGLLSSAMELGLRVSAPLLCLIFLETLAMGFLARTVPQLNILSIGFPLRILAGTALIIGALLIQATVYRDSMTENLYALTHLLGR